MSKPWATFLIFTFLFAETAFSQPPVRKFDDAGSPPFKVLKTGENPPLDVELRMFISVGDRDLLNPNVMRDGMHDWVEANNRMAKVLKAKGYEYQHLFCRNAGHSIGNAQAPIAIPEDHHCSRETVSISSPRPSFSSDGRSRQPRLSLSRK